MVSPGEDSEYSLAAFQARLRPAGASVPPGWAWTVNPVEYAPNRFRGEFAGHHITHGKPPIPITVRVEWSDGGEGEVNGWTLQWTRTHVRVHRNLEPGQGDAFWVLTEDVMRR